MGELFTRELIEQATMTMEAEAAAKKGDCPDCRGQLTKRSESDGLAFWRCDACGDVFVLSA